MITIVVDLWKRLDSNQQHTVCKTINLPIKYTFPWLLTDKIVWLNILFQQHILVQLLCYDLFAIVRLYNLVTWSQWLNLTRWYMKHANNKIQPNYHALTGDKCMKKFNFHDCDMISHYYLVLLHKSKLQALIRTHKIL